MRGSSNHADPPDCRDRPDPEGALTIGARDIAAGEELTSDYAAIDVNYGRDRKYRKRIPAGAFAAGGRRVSERPH